MKKTTLYTAVILASLIVGIFTPASVLSGRSPTGCPDNYCHLATLKCKTDLQDSKCMNGSIPTAGSNADCTGSAGCLPE